MNQFGSQDKDIIGRWSEDKLDLLAKYLKAYSTIMNKQKREWLKGYEYVDAFAGSITPISKEEQRYVEGSPLRALRTQPPFDRYWFIDVNPKRLERLSAICQTDEFHNLSIEIRQGDCNLILREQVIPKISKSERRRGIIFLDPYGLQVLWSTIQTLATVGTFDLFINFSIMGVTRLLPRDSPPSNAALEQINSIMGKAEWINEIYKPPASEQLGLFDKQELSLKRESLRAEWLASLYAEYLHSLFEHVSQPVIMKNSTNSAIYALYLASHNKTAVKITNDIFKGYEKLRI